MYHVCIKSYTVSKNDELWDKDTYCQYFGTPDMFTFHRDVFLAALRMRFSSFTSNVSTIKRG